MGRFFTSDPTDPSLVFSGPLHTRRCGTTLSKQERAGDFLSGDNKEILRFNQKSHQKFVKNSEKMLDNWKRVWYYI